MLDETLRCYRADPNNRTFRAVHRAWTPWLRAAGTSVLRRFWGLSYSDLDDVVNDGLLALSQGARRYVFFCARCGDVFLDGADLRRHAREEHGVRGDAALVDLGTFCRTSARIKMRACAARLLHPEEVLEADPDPGVILDAEDRVLVEVLLRRADARLRGGMADVLRRALIGDLPAHAELLQLLR